MATKISELQVMLDAKTGAFSRKMRQASRQSKVLGGGIGFLNNKLLALGGLLVGGLTIRGMTNMISSSMKMLDIVAKTSDKLGIESKALIGLQHAASISGVGVEKTNMALQRMTRRVAEAGKGTGEARGALRELGLDATALAAMSPDQQFLQVADAMGAITTQSDKVRLSFKLFDSEGVALVNTLNMGRGGIEAMMREAESLGIALNRMELAKIEQANDAMTRVKAAMQGVSNVAATHLAPAIETVSTMFVDWLTSSKDGVTTLGNGIDALIGTLGSLGDAMTWIKKRSIEVQSNLLGMIQKPMAFAGKWLKDDKGGFFAKHMADALGDQIDDLNSKWKGLAKGESFSERFAAALAGTEAKAMETAAAKVAEVMEPVIQGQEANFLGAGQGESKQVNFATGFRPNNPITAASAQANNLAKTIAQNTQRGNTLLQQIAQNTSGGNYATVSPG